MNSINIGVLDQHDLFRESLASLMQAEPDFNVVFRCDLVQEVAAFLSRDNIHLLVIDPCNQGEDCAWLIKDYIHEFPSLKVMILTDQVDRNSVLKLIQCGVSGIYSKNTAPAKFNAAIREIMMNHFQFDVKLGPEIREKLISEEIGLNKYTNPQDIVFSKRELQILDLICQERTNQEISDILSLSVRTIETHRRRMIEKTESKNMIGVILFAFKIKSANSNRTQFLSY